MFKIQS